MSAPFAGPPSFNSLAGPNIHDELGALNSPSKHYQWYCATREADANIRNCPQEIHAFLRAYVPHDEPHDAPRHKQHKGERVGNIRYGYRLAADGTHVEHDPVEQKALAEIRRLRKRGGTLRDIAAALNRRQLRTRRGSAWRQEHVARITTQGVSDVAVLSRHWMAWKR